MSLLKDKNGRTGVLSTGQISKSVELKLNVYISKVIENLKIRWISGAVTQIFALKPNGSTIKYMVSC